jgi:hypothetical protein
MASAPTPPKLSINDHVLGWGPVQVHTRYIVDAGLIVFGVGALFVSLFIIAEPDVSALTRKAIQAGAKVAPLAV